MDRSASPSTPAACSCGNELPARQKPQKQGARCPQDRGAAAGLRGETHWLGSQAPGLGCPSLWPPAVPCGPLPFTVTLVGICGSVFPPGWEPLGSRRSESGFQGPHGVGAK